MRPGKRQRAKYALGLAQQAAYDSVVQDVVRDNLSEFKRNGKPQSFSRSVDSTLAVQSRVLRDGFRVARCVGPLGSGTPKPKTSTPRFGAKHERDANANTGPLNDLRKAERTAFIQEHSVDGKFVAPKKD